MVFTDSYQALQRSKSEMVGYSEYTMMSNCVFVPTNMRHLQRRRKTRMLELPAAGRHMRLQHPPELGRAIESWEEASNGQARNADDQLLEHAASIRDHVSAHDGLRIIKITYDRETHPRIETFEFSESACNQDRSPTPQSTSEWLYSPSITADVSITPIRKLSSVTWQPRLR